MDRNTRLRLAAASLLGLSLPLAAHAAPRSHERHPAPVPHPAPGHRPLRATLSQITTLPAGIPSGGFVLQNPTGTALAARNRSTGIGFARGALPAGSGLTATVGGAAAPVQLDVHSTWPDGSARWASVTVPAPALAAGASVPVALTVTGSPAAGAALAWTSPALTINLLGSTLDLGAALASSTDTWELGALAVQRRVDLPVPGDSTGAMHVVADVTIFANGPAIADVQVRRDVATVVAFTGSNTQGAALVPLSYTATITLNGATTTQAVSNQNQYQDWHVVLGDDGINVQHDVAGLEAAGLLPPFDLAMGINTASGGGYASEVAAMAQSGFGQPMATNGVATYMPTTGGRYDIGITTGALAIWLRTQDDAARRYALAQADTGGAVPWHFWDASAGRWMDAVDHPNLWATQVSYTDFLANALPPNDTSNTPSTQPWTPVMNHAPNLDYIPALLTGSRFYRDMQQAQANAAVLWDWPTNRRPVGAGSGGGDQVFGGLEVREIAWDYREIVEAWALASTGGTPAAHLAQMLADSWSWWNNAANAPAWITQDGNVGLMVPNRYGTANMYPMWEHAYMLAAFGMGVLLGDPGAVGSNAFPAVLATTEQSAVPQTGYDPANSIEYLWAYESSAGSFVTSWAGLQAAQQSNGWPRTPAQLDTFGDYDSLLRQSLAMALRINPGDTVAQAGLSGLYGAVTSTTSNISTATYQAGSTGGNLPQEALAIPTVSSTSAWATQEAALAAGGSGSSSTTGTSSSAGSSTSTGSTSTGSTTSTSVTGTVSSVSGASLPYPGEPLIVPIGGLHLATANGVTAAAVAGAIPVTATTLPSSCRPGDAYYIRGARLSSQAAGAGLDAPGYCNAAGQVVLTATGLPPTF